MLDRPALLDPLAERRAVALGELLHGQRAELPAAAKLGLERLGVGAAVERARAVRASLAEPHLPVAAAVLVSLDVDAHGRSADRSPWACLDGPRVSLRDQIASIAAIMAS